MGRNPGDSNGCVFMVIIIVSALLFASCAAAVQHIQPCLVTNSHVFGFWGGLWHGFISPVTFIISLFPNNVTVWAVNNNGGWYTFGFLLGVGITGGSSASIKNRIN